MATLLESDVAKPDDRDEGECSASQQSLSNPDHPSSHADGPSQQPNRQQQPQSNHYDNDEGSQSLSHQSSTSWDLYKKEDRRSSLRQSTKQRTQHSPRWRDQQEQHQQQLVNNQAGALADPSWSINMMADHIHESLLTETHHHNDSASQTSHTYSDAAYSHHSGYGPDVDAENEDSLNFSSSHHHHHHGKLNPMIHNETRFPTAMGYAASEAAKSDIATVCSGSVIEDIDRDIDMASVASGEFVAHNHQSGGGNSALVERFVLKRTSGSGGMHNTQQQQQQTQQQSNNHGSTASVSGGATSQNSNNASSNNKHERGDSNTSRGVEFASHTHTYPFHRNAPSHHLLSEEISRDMLAATRRTINNDTNNSNNNNMYEDSLNDMGPPLSRTLLLAATAAASSIDHHTREGGHSRAGSVRSFCSGEAPSDVVAHVDTDDCGGSMSEVSQEDHKDERNCCGELGVLDDTTVLDNTATLEPQNLGDAQKMASAVATTTNGRVSPGGTIYKGKGVRRYQGRYMKLPLKRFHQGEFNETVVQNPLAEGEDLYGDSDNDIPAQPPQFDDWSNSGYRSLSRSFSRSISPPPSRSRSRSRSESPRDNMRRRRPSWSPHRGSDRKRPIKNNTRRSPSRSPSPPVRNDRPPIPRSHSPPQRIHSKGDEGKWRKRQSPSRNLQIREREGNDGRWRRDRWNNDRQVKSRSRSRSRSGPRRSPRRGRKRKGDRSSRSKS
ncbi:hypothetical protein ACHAWO_009625 [Cyclotella atomus]|uniref:Uncharacterized protein n=1 Tax=Cyclotella atomus TaxID=382360 RepID=A0ABD3N325_9STRA